MRGAVSLSLVAFAIAARLGAQAPTVAEHIALGDSADAALAPAQALQHYRAALALDSTNYEALWKAGRELVNVAKQIDGKDDSSKHLRDSLYTEARAYSESAVRVNPKGADGHFEVGEALGRLSRTKGGKERVRFEDNACVLVDDKKLPRGTEIKGCVAREISERFPKVVAIASAVV